MSSIRQFLWKLLVVGMIPFILGAGLPQMECRCAAAKGQRWCECCFRKPDEAQPANSPLKSCCLRRLTSQDKAPTIQKQEHDSGCPTCHQFLNPKTGSCCSLKHGDTPTLTKQVDVPSLEIALPWLPMAVNGSSVSLAKTALGHEMLSRAALIPPVDRIIVFEHLLI